MFLWGGGNYVAAHNLRLRGLRLFSYPFDWTYFKEEKAIYKIADSFKNHFQNLLLKENLIELPINLSHPECVQYEEKDLKIIWANHFHKKVTDETEYNKVTQTIKRRCLRLLEQITKSKKILFIFSTSFKVNLKPFQYLMKKLNLLYPHKNFEIMIVSFNCPKTEKQIYRGITLYRFSREMNDYDFTKTNYEWHFLDDMELSFVSHSPKNLWVQFIIKNCPFRKMRKKLREKYHV